MSNEFAEVVQSQQHDCDATIGEEVEEADNCRASNRVLDLGRLFVLLDLLEVQFREHVQVIRELNDEVQLVQEAHRVVRIVRPKLRHVLGVLLANDHLGAPQERHQVEHDQLAGFVETRQLELREVQFLGNFLKGRVRLSEWSSRGHSSYSHLTRIPVRLRA